MEKIQDLRLSERLAWYPLEPQQTHEILKAVKGILNLFGCSYRPKPEEILSRGAEVLLALSKLAGQDLEAWEAVR